MRMNEKYKIAYELCNCWEKKILFKGGQINGKIQTS